MTDQTPRGTSSPAIQDTDADRRFRERAKEHGWDPDDRFVGGYVEWEWERSRHLFDGLFASVAGTKALEFGCHFGGTAIVLAALGADVTALDVDPQFVELSQLNAARYGLAERVRVLHVPDTSRLPFEDGEFSIISCNSVLEYVPFEIRGAVLRELDRVLAPRGTVVILGTSNRLWPREQHSGRWLMNYVPRSLRHLFPGKSVESVFPWRIKAGFPGYVDLFQEHDGQLFLDLKRRMGVSGGRLAVLSAADRLLRRLRLHVGIVSPTMTMVLEKP